ncbi:hypothetical protein [Lactococcus petauri]|uniref:hypothetical protein n=1 Tax=Lactococcus petauri TaxID=1940789 RepID=UPI0022E3BD23|nr:hypothetical protein [Lactococcus petauri]
MDIELISKLSKKYQELIKETTDYVMKKNNNDKRKARKYLYEQLYYTDNKSTHELITIVINHLKD